jgi:eukaryotic-like serine/threonine-protein kinase
MNESNPASGLQSDLVNGRYRLIEPIGAGGMGRVWLADDELLMRRVAVKELVTPADVTTSGLLDLQIRTMREARAAARLDHPGVVKIFDVVWRPGRSWIVMEYVKSRSLHDVVRADGPMTHREAARIGLQILSALVSAHAGGVLHRDVKPQNVLLAEDGRVVLSDFGLATIEGADGGPDPLMGSPYYVAPERLRGDESGEPADLWSLGATLYAATEGRPPFARDTTVQSLSALLNEPPDEPRRPGQLTPTIMALLAKAPTARLTSAETEPRLRRAAERAVGVFPLATQFTPGVASTVRGLARVQPVSRNRVEPAYAETAPVIENGPRRPRRFVLAGAAVLLVGALGTAAAVNLDRNGPASSIAAAEMPVAAPQLSPCGFNDPDAAPAAAATGKAPVLLPAGWIWHRDPVGFAVALPQGWNRSVTGSAVCFSDPVGGRAFTVDTAAPVTRQPLRYWQNAERAALEDGSLPGYDQVSMGVLLLRKGGADWEYVWQPGSGPRQHVRRVLLATGAQRSYLLRWTASDRDWSQVESLQQRAVSTFQQTT